MHLSRSLLLLAPLLLSTTSARPHSQPDAESDQPTRTLEQRGSQQSCLPSPTASALVTAWASLLTSFSSTTAQSLLSTSYLEYSDSVSALASQPLGRATFASKAAFIQQSSAQPALPSLQILNIDAITCGGTIAVRWLAQVGCELREVKGINIFYVGWTGEGGFGGWQIETAFGEFNSLGWMVDIGGSVTAPVSRRGKRSGGGMLGLGGGMDPWEDEL